MKLSSIINWPKLALLACGLVTMVATTGCGTQARIAGQSLPSAHYLRDDVQFFPTGPEDKLSTLRAELETYSGEQQAIQQGLEDEAP